MRSNPEDFANAEQVTVFRIGTHVLLTVERRNDAALQPSIPATRSVDIAGDDVVFRLHQVSNDFDLSSLAVPIEDCLLAIPQRFRLSAREWQRFLTGLFGTAATMFKLRTDAGFIRFAASLLEATERRSRLQLHQVSGFRTKIGVIPAQTKVRKDDLLVCFSAEQLTVGRIEDSHKYLLRPSPANEIVSIAARGEVTGEVGLLLTADGPVKAMLDISDYPSFSDFYGSLERDNFDLVSVFSGFGSDAQPIVAPLSPDLHQPQFHDRRFNIRFEITTGLPLDHGFFASGWFFDPDDQIASVTAADHTLVEPTISNSWKIFHGRVEIDADKLQIRRFVSFQPRRASSNPPGDVRIRVTLKNGLSYIIAPRVASCDALTQRDAALDTIAGYAFSPDQFADVFRPAIEPLQVRLNRRQKIRETRELGARSSRKVSLVIPIYRELGFIRSQLAAFALDPYIRSQCEIVYANDDPSIALTLTSVISSYLPAFPLDIKIVTLDRNGGYALANNMAASEAEGDILILMNSDVVPLRQGWIEPAIQKLDALPAFSVIGPKLLYPDGSLQHAGMYFQHSEAGYWQNNHFWKGYGRDLPEANLEREVPAVTGACMFIRRPDYHEVGGFSDDYIIGDFEDSDLCLKLRSRGGLSYYLPSIELCHFERQSMAAGGEAMKERGSTRYNEALHAAKWGDVIAQIDAAGMGRSFDLQRSERPQAVEPEIRSFRRKSNKMS